MNFLVLDFETANKDKSSICQVGLVEYNNGEIITHLDEYINPLSKFDTKSPFFFKKHNISENNVKDALTFEKLYPKLKFLIENKIVFNHNMSDKNFFQAAFSKYNLEVFSVKWLNSLTLVKRTWPDLVGGHSIENIADYLSIKYKAHNAASDCFATTKIIEAALKIKLLTLEDWIKELTKSKKRNNSNYNDVQRISGELLEAPNLDEVDNKKNPFFNKKIVVSGKYSEWPDRKDLVLLLKRAGAKICSNMGQGNARRDFLCAGEGVGPKKIEKMKQLITNGNGGEIINENQIIEIISKYNLK